MVVFAAIEYVTVPFAVPLAPPVTVSHPADDVAVQLQAAGAVTETLPVVALGETEALVGEMVMVHGTPVCVTVKVCPPIVSVPVREAAVVFCATVYDTVPFAVPVAPAVTVIHDALLVPVQAQPPGAATATLPVAPAAGTVAAVGDSA